MQHVARSHIIASQQTSLGSTASRHRERCQSPKLRMMASTNRIVELSAIIAKGTETINNFLVEHKLPIPSLDEDAISSSPIPGDAIDVKAVRATVTDACSELNALLTGPEHLLRFEWTAFSSVKAILRFNLDRSFPIGGSTTFEAMSTFSGLNVMNVRRIVRHAIINHYFFREKSPGIITHSALTATLARDDLARNHFLVRLDEFWPAATRLADAMEKWPNSQESSKAAFTLVNNSAMGMYEILAENRDRAERFGMYFCHPDESPLVLVDNYQWAEKRTMVDVGGSHGHIVRSIAERFPHMKCFVQDLPDTVAVGAARLPVELKDRVIFMAHDFFTEQPVKADVYYFRSIFHNWADEYCIKILQNLVPALERGARVVIHDRILPRFEDMSTPEARNAINMDVGMLSLLNSQQREMHEWPELFRRADSRFRYMGARQPVGTIRWLIEAEWEG
ncbi:S-adenosyl-L-methionine-dependent methyltransferase [Xylaria intraflava]|nr:S-adenosyl-L-methionine-dependent methyltransferase [Xylaria intraflava]